ncbi:hypothetical protein NP493_444g02020 [Ridgeia piscesae]|uniref:Uncharacterized protein n=1 Tax=Ridgeia piscesae TaxID=27915 RepID=A0AAD9KZ79_RIDPI|nr:hypothetical protein NP493_444g02020 [Ridgeia piscesae]
MSCSPKSRTGLASPVKCGVSIFYTHLIRNVSCVFASHVHGVRFSSLSKRMQIREHISGVLSTIAASLSYIGCFKTLVRILISHLLLTNRFEAEPFYSNVVLTQNA